MEKIKTDSPCNLCFYIYAKRWEFNKWREIVYYQCSPLKRKTSAHPNAPSRKVSSSAPHPHPPVFLKLRTNVGLERRWRISERRAYNAQNKSPLERQTGWAFSSRACGEQSVRVASDCWVVPEGHWGPKAEDGATVTQVRDHQQISNSSKPDMRPVFCK